MLPTKKESKTAFIHDPYCNSEWAGVFLDSPFPPPLRITQTNIAALFFEQVNNQEISVFAEFRLDPTAQWSAMSWEEAGAAVQRVALFLKNTVGIKKGDRVAILSQSRLEWILADISILSIGAISVPIYQTLSTEEAAYIIWDADVRHVFIENQEQYDKLLKIATKPQPLPKTEYSEGGKLQLNCPTLTAFENVSDSHFGEKLSQWFNILEAAVPENHFDLKQFAATEIKRDDLASIVYTSGTTGPPKGVVQTHNNHLAMLDAVLFSGLVDDAKRVFLFLPLAHSFARLIGYSVIARGGSYIFPTIIDRSRSRFEAFLMFSDIRQTAPRIFPSVPRIFEKVMTSLVGSVPKSPRDRLVRWAIQFRIDEDTKISGTAKIGGVLNQLKSHLARAVVAKIKTRLFGGKLLHAISGGAPISLEVLRFFQSLSIPIYQGYGLTETTPALTANTPKYNMLGTVGRVFEGVQLRVAKEDGEILARGPNVASGYWKQPKATAEAWNTEGWFATGDIGEINKDGYLTITDRKKELIVNAGGKKIPPALIEGLLKNCPYISQAFVFGDKRPYLVALFTLNLENLKQWAQANNKSLEKDLIMLAESKVIKDLLRQAVETMNSRLANYEQVKKFAVLPEDFTVENGLLTPTLKLRRKKVAERYFEIIESLYNK